MVVLIVEDEALIALSLALELEDAGHTVVGPTGRCATALALARAHRPTVALLDITLEHPQDGIPLARSLQQLGVPSLFLSAQPAEARANADAALGFIPKPYTTESVCQSLEVVAEILAGHSIASNMGALEVFPSARNSTQ